MPHLIVEYSANLEPRLDIEGLLRHMHCAVMETGAFQEEGIRIRACARMHFLIGNGEAANAFIHATVRIRPGRPEHTKLALTEHLFNAMCQSLEKTFSSTPLGLTFEVQEIDLQFRRLKSTLLETPNTLSHGSAKQTS